MLRALPVPEDRLSQVVDVADAGEAQPRVVHLVLVAQKQRDFDRCGKGRVEARVGIMSEVRARTAGRATRSGQGLEAR